MRGGAQTNKSLRGGAPTINSPPGNLPFVCRAVRVMKGAALFYSRNLLLCDRDEGHGPINELEREGPRPSHSSPWHDPDQCIDEPPLMLRT